MSPQNANNDRGNDDGTGRRIGPPSRGWRWIGLVIVVAIVAALGIGIHVGIRDRAEAESELARDTQLSAIPVVNVLHPEGNAASQALVLPGNTEAYIDTGIYARTSGYLRHWYFDIGARVQKGQLLAEIETPEVDEQLREARADLATAQANLNLARVTAERYEKLLKTESVATQDRDNAVGVYNADKAIVRSKQADVARLEQLQSFEKIYAPFDGVITARETDIGALINAGAGTPSMELFHMAAVKTLRIYVAVPEVYASDMKAGSSATVTVDEFPNQVFHGTLVRTSNSIDRASRTLLVEVDVDNRDYRLMPGAYAFVHFDLPSRRQSVTIPASTLLFRHEGLRVGVVRDGKAILVPIKIGRDFGDRVEVISGLEASDEVIANPPDSLISGTPVRLHAESAGKAKP